MTIGFSLVIVMFSEAVWMFMQVAQVWSMSERIVTVVRGDRSDYKKRKKKRHEACLVNDTTTGLLLPSSGGMQRRRHEKD